MIAKPTIFENKTYVLPNSDQQIVNCHVDFILISTARKIDLRLYRSEILRAVNLILMGGKTGQLYTNLNWIEVYLIKQDQINTEVEQTDNCFVWARQFSRYLLRQNPTLLGPYSNLVEARQMFKIVKW